MMNTQPPMMMYITAKGPKLCAAFVSLKIATKADVHRIHVNDPVLKKLICKKKLNSGSNLLSFVNYLVDVTRPCFNIVANHGQDNCNR